MKRISVEMKDKDYRRLAQKAAECGFSEVHDMIQSYCNSLIAVRGMKISDAEDVAELFADIAHLAQENFCVAYLSAANRVISKKILFRGTIDLTTIHPREIFGWAARLEAKSVILAHNHPSGESQPSPEDLERTKQLIEVGKTMMIPVLDHVIMTSDGYCSMLENNPGMFKTERR